MTSLLNSIKNLARQNGEDTKTRFSVAPAPGDSGFTQWQNGMRMVARLPEGIPSQFRKTLWLNLAEKHLASRGVQWSQVEEFCFNEYTNPDDEELGVQIVKDVHRTGCSLFCGVSGKDNQALLKRVLLAYARWNKAVGYCQGFNMLAALILQVMDKSEVDSVKVMIFLIEGVLPESYFANNLRGLSVDMAVFRDLLRIKLPTLSRHFDQLQSESKDSGTSYEPPLTNVFTMQWFLTLFCNCLPQDTVLRVWDLIFLEGNHILLSTALAIWSTLSDRIMTVESADEFYSIMGVLTREMLEFGLMDANALIKAIVGFTLPELPELREKYLYNITPWTQSVSTVARRGLRLFYSDDDTDTEEDDEKIAIATAYGLFRSPKRKDGATGVTSPPRALTCPDKEKIAMDISALTKQYRKLRERQKQAHVILTAACGNQSLVGPTSSHVAMNHLLMGKFALVNNKGRRLGPPPGSIPPPSQPRPRQGEKQTITISGETLHWKDTADGKKIQQRDNSDEEHSPEPGSRRSSSSSTSTELCDDPQRSPSDSEDLSDASAFLPSDTEPSTPKRLMQPKVQHPSDIISCKEEDEEAVDKTEEEKHTRQSVLEVQLNDSKSCKSLSPVSMKSLSPTCISPDDEEKSHKRKLSFRIDPEELRQLDRKLSLKIVEIERRKSSAGIESEDLNSKVLFPFDRDYIQEMEKCDRDTPSSIPDDRMCSTEDYLSGFEEETILVPDIITTHKPVTYRMASVEECDETKVNESYDDTDGNPADSMAEEEVNDAVYADNESPELYDGEEEDEETETPYTSYNFDELFIKQDLQNKNCFEQRENNDYYSGNSNSSEFSSKHQLGSRVNSPVTILKSEQTEGLNCSSQSRPGTSCFKSDEHDSSSGLLQRSLYLSDDMKAKISVSESVGDGSIATKVLNHESSGLPKCDPQCSGVNTVSQSSNETSSSVNETFELKSHGVSRTTSPNLSDSEKALERKLASVLPKLASLSFDSSMPDVAAVTSREARINSIREKYANLGQTSKDEVDSVEPECSHLSMSNSKAEQEKVISTEKVLPTFNNVSTNSIDPVDTTLIHKITSFHNASETLQNPMSDTHESDKSTETQSNNSRGNSSDRLKEEQIVVGTGDSTEIKITPKVVAEELEELKRSNTDITTKTKEEPKHDNIDNKEIDQQKNNCDEEPRRPSSVSSNRRGSEVALSLILKENSQILSKIQQQSRRNSEVNVDQTLIYQRFLRSESPEEDIEKLKSGQEISALTKAIMNINTDSTNSFQCDDMKPELCNKLSSANSRLSPENLEDDVCGRNVISSDETLWNKTKSNFCNDNDKKTETSEIFAAKKIVKQEEILLESNLNEKHNSLPDLCKFENDTSISSNPKNTVVSLDTFQPYMPSTLNSERSENTNDITVKITKDSYSYSKRPSIMSPTTEVDENSPPEINTKMELISTSTVNEPTDYLVKSSDKLSTYPVISALHRKSDYLQVEAKDFEIDSLSDTNEDIIKELRALDIKPEEVLEYSESNVIPITPVTPDESIIRRKTSPVEDMLKFSSEVDDQYSFKKSFTDLSYDRSPRHRFHDSKMASFDVSSTKTDLYEESYRPSIRSSKTLDNDDSLYLSSYKSHGRLLIEKGELDPYRSLDKEPYKFESSSTDRKLLKSEEENESAYDFRSSSSRVNRSYSEFLSDDVRSSISKTEPRDKTLFRYKSEDYGRSMSPPHHRFSSASPVRKRLDTLPTESLTSPYSSFTRAKSPSPTYYGSSHSLRRDRDSSLIRSPERSTDCYESSKDFKRYSRTESLDFSHVEDRSYLKKRAESFDVSTSDKHGDKKLSLSPQKFNPFPVRSSSRQPKELGVKLGLYLPQKSDKSPSKHVT